MFYGTIIKNNCIMVTESLLMTYKDVWISDILSLSDSLLSHHQFEP